MENNIEIYYPSDYSSIADLPKDLQKMAESIGENIRNVRNEMDEKISEIPAEVIISSEEPTTDDWKILIDENEEPPEYVTIETFNETVGNIESLLAEV